MSFLFIILILLLVSLSASVYYYYTKIYNNCVCEPGNFCLDGSVQECPLGSYCPDKNMTSSKILIRVTASNIFRAATLSILGIYKNIKYIFLLP